MAALRAPSRCRPGTPYALAARLGNIGGLTTWVPAGVLRHVRARVTVVTQGGQRRATAGGAAAAATPCGGQRPGRWAPHGTHGTKAVRATWRNAGDAGAERGAATRARASGPADIYRAKGGDGRKNAPKREEGNEAVRIAKALAAAGVASRRASETLVREGRVAVNGNVIDTPVTSVTPGVDDVTVDGVRVDITTEPRVYFVLNKPKGWICATEGAKSPEQPPLLRDAIAKDNDPWQKVPKRGANKRGTQTGVRAAEGGPGATASLGRQVVDLIGEYLEERWPLRYPERPLPRVFTVGRLDVATTGLLLVTNDGALANNIAHPRHALTREYMVTLNRNYTRGDVQTMADGVDIDGTTVSPLEVLPVPGDGPMGRNPRKLVIIVGEGRNREVRRLVEGAGNGLEVRHLKRTRLGALRLPQSLREGHFVELTAEEAYRIPDLKQQAMGGRSLWKANRATFAAPAFKRVGEQDGGGGGGGGGGGDFIEDGPGV